DFENLPMGGTYPITPEAVHVGNNTFSNNVFGFDNPDVNWPLLTPTSAMVDKGGNACDSSPVLSCAPNPPNDAGVVPRYAGRDFDTGVGPGEGGMAPGDAGVPSIDSGEGTRRGEDGGAKSSSGHLDSGNFGGSSAEKRGGSCALDQPQSDANPSALLL